MPQADLRSIAFVAQRFLIQSPMNGYGKMTNVTHFNAIVSASCNELRHRLTLQDATDEDKRNLPLRSVQQFQCLRFVPIGAGVLGDNQVIGVLAQPLAKLLGSNNDFRGDREMHPVELLQAALHLRCVTMGKKDVQRRMSAFGSAQGIALEAGLGGSGHLEPTINSREPVLPFALLAPVNEWTLSTKSLWPEGISVCSILDTSNIPLTRTAYLWRANIPCRSRVCAPRVLSNWVRSWVHSLSS